MPRRIEEQLEAARGDRIRVLVVGAGIAGAGIAQLLRKEGLHPVLLERSPSSLESGYMLGLMPLIDEPLRRLGVWDEYRARSVAMHRYQLRSSRDRLVRTYSLDAVLGEFGRYGGIERSELMTAITGNDLPVTLEATVTGLDQDADGVTATLTGDDRVSTARFDLVIAADGLHSHTRSLVLRADEVDTFDTGWGGWVAWADQDPDESGTYTETWGRGFFIGRYPVPGRVGIFIGGPNAETAAGPTAFTNRLRSQLHDRDPVTLGSLEAIEHANDPYLWRFTDTRAQRWATGRVVLLGDAAAGFLPTAGIGATMALESAAVLAANLSNATSKEIADRLREYERLQRPRVIAAHENSRQLAKLMFRQGRIVCTARDIAMRFATMNMALGPIINLHRNAPPAAV
jgi:salicylate hydroxylase